MHWCRKCEFGSQHYRAYIRHVFLKHSLDQDFKVSCVVGTCKKNYRSARCLLRHLRQKHQDFYRVNFQTKQIQGQENIGEPVDDFNINIFTGGRNVQLPINENFHEDLKLSLAKQLLKLREFHNLSCSAVTAVTDLIQNIGTAVKSNLVSKVVQYVAQNDYDSLQDIENTLNSTDELEEACTSLDSQKKLESFAETNLSVVKPVEQVIFSNNSIKQTYQYVPILETLKYLLKFEDIFSEVINGNVSTDRKLRDICDGSLYKENPLFSQNHRELQIILYFDDFNIVNPFGNKVKKYKLSAFYMTLGNIHPVLRSQHKSVFLVALCRAKLLKKYGFEGILQPLIEDLQRLENEGVTVEKDGQQVNLKGTVVATCCDNLASHSIGGFIESFITLKPCRFCNVTLDSLRNGDCGTLRTKQSYNGQCDVVSQFPDLGKAYGLKKVSVLNKLQYYHIIHGLPSDLSHDIFEGIGKTLLSQVISSCIESGYFSIAYLNSIIDSYPWKADDKTNKPCNLYYTGGKIDVKLTSSQCFCLLRTLPLLVGEHVPVDDLKWHVFLLFRDIVDYVCMPAVTLGQIDFLSDLIDNFISDYRQQYPDKRLTAKFHYLLHYPYQMKLFGPLRNLWTLRFEAKHQQLKNSFKLNKCHKNICKSLANRHQIRLSLAAEGVNYFSPGFDFAAKLRNENIFSLPDNERNAIEKHTDNVELPRFKTLKFGTSLFRADETCIITGISGDRVQFSKLLYFVQINTCPYVMLRKMNTVEYMAHFHSFSITECDDVLLKDFSRILHEDQYLGIYYLPNTLQQCVTLKYRM